MKSQRHCTSTSIARAHRFFGLTGLAFFDFFFAPSDSDAELPPYSSPESEGSSEPPPSSDALSSSLNSCNPSERPAISLEEDAATHRLRAARHVEIARTGRKSALGARLIRVRSIVGAAA